MFFSNLVKKGFGFVREVILAYVFGSSLIYSFYILLKTIVDIFSQFTFGNALQANLLPKLSKHFEEHNNVSYFNLFSFTKRSLIYIFIISLIVQLIIIWRLNTQYTFVLILLACLLSILLLFNVFNSVFLTVLQAEGRFKDYSYATAFNLFIATILVYPFSIIFNIIGPVVSRLAGAILLMNKYLIPILKRKKSNEVDIGIYDFSFSVLLLGNLPNIIIMLSRFISGTDGDNTIAYFNYAIVLLNVVLTAIIANLNTLMLRKLSISKDIKWLIYSFFISLFCGAILYLFVFNFSDEFIRLVYFRGAFTLVDLAETSQYFQQMTGAIIILLISSVLLQPYFTLDLKLRRKYSSKLLFVTLGFIFSLLIVLFSFEIDARIRSLIFLYFMSFTTLMLSIFTCIKYIKNEN
tara:strand:+ start:6147 stop:7367 length:1221 start_codon:yes stop_codon:yes gene_type:complete